MLWLHVGMRCQHVRGMEEQQEKRLLQLGWYFLHGKHHSLLTVKLLHSGSKSVFCTQSRGKSCMCANLCFCFHPAWSTCVCLSMQVGIQSQAFVLGYMNTCIPAHALHHRIASFLAWCCACTSLYKPTTASNSLLLNSGNRYFLFWAEIMYLGPYTYFDVFSVFKNPYSAAVLWNVALLESPDCEIWGFFCFLLVSSGILWPPVDICPVHLVCVHEWDSTVPPGNAFFCSGPYG